MPQKLPNGPELELHKPSDANPNSSHGTGARDKSAIWKMIFYTTAIHGPPTTTPQHTEEILLQGSLLEHSIRLILSYNELISQCHLQPFLSTITVKLNSIISKGYSKENNHISRSHFHKFV